MPNPDRYFVETRKDETLAVKGEGKERAARVVSSETKAVRLAHHYVPKDGTVEFKDAHGRFTECPCHRCKVNRDR